MTRWRKWLIAASAFALGVLVAIVWLREPTTALTSQTLSEARQRWRSAGMRSYDARFMMHNSLYEVRVRNGLVEEIAVNGRVPSSAQPGAYSIEGLFDTLETEIENLSDPAGPLSGGMLPRVRFNDRFGYPEYYVRAGSGGARSVTMKMLHFAPAVP